MDERDHRGEGGVRFSEVEATVRDWGTTTESRGPARGPSRWLFPLLRGPSQGHLTLSPSFDHFLTACCARSTGLGPGHMWRHVHAGENEPREGEWWALEVQRWVGVSWTGHPPEKPAL